MSRFFPRDVVQWSEQQLHPLRAFAIRAIEPAGVTGLVVRLYRATVLTSSFTAGPVPFLFAVLLAVVFLCGMLTWHLGNFPIRRWPLRVAVFVAIEVAAELGMSSILIALGRERIGSRIAAWGDWWAMAGQTLFERVFVLGLYTLVLAVSVQLVRRMVDRREQSVPRAALRE